MNDSALRGLLRKVYGDTFSLHSDLYELSEQHRHTHGEGCMVYPHSPEYAPLWPLLAAMIGAHRFLEVGCGLGYTAALLAETGGPNAHVDTVEKVSAHADLAEGELRQRGLAQRVRVLRGDAVAVLSRLRQTYDLVFMDADWKDYPALLPHVTRLVRPGGILFTSNLFPLFGDRPAGLADRKAVEDYLIALVGDPRFRTFILPGEWKALSYRMPAGA